MDEQTERHRHCIQPTLCFALGGGVNSNSSTVAEVRVKYSAPGTQHKPATLVHRRPSSTESLHYCLAPDLSTPAAAASTTDNNVKDVHFHCVPRCPIRGTFYAT